MTSTRWIEAVRTAYDNPKIRRLAHEVAYLTAKGEHPSDEQLAKAVGVDRRTVRRYRHALHRDGLLAWSGSNGGKNVYVLKTPAVFNLKRLTCEQCDGPIRDAQRSTRRFCSERCRKAASRAKNGA